MGLEVDRKRRVPLKRQVREGLAQGAVVRDDLIDGVVKVEQRLARQGLRISSGGPRNLDAFFRVIVFFSSQGSYQLVKECWHAIGKVLFAGCPIRALRHFRLAVSS
jgi:hypothetical protein